MKFYAPGLPSIMGILNVTPNSFSDGGKYLQLEKAVAQALKLEAEGAAVIDIGGESTKPGAEAASLEEELKRVIPVIKEIRKNSKILISIDTYKSKVAEAALEAGANMINDISACRFDPQMVNIIAEFKCPIVIMHMKGTPKDMQNAPFYTDVVDEILTFFEERLHFLNSHKIDDIIIDPGIGFGKRIEDNLAILKKLSIFKSLKKPILIGTSRKSFIGTILNKPVEQRLSGSIASNIAAFNNGADIFRVHDVKETVDAFKIYNHIFSQTGKK
jgi:dihydropteroate synthase